MKANSKYLAMPGHCDTMRQKFVSQANKQQVNCAAHIRPARTTHRVAKQLIAGWHGAAGKAQAAFMHDRVAGGGIARDAAVHLSKCWMQNAGDTTFGTICMSDATFLGVNRPVVASGIAVSVRLFMSLCQTTHSTCPTRHLQSTYTAAETDGALLPAA